MDHKDHDKVFFVNFGAVMAALFGIFFVCIFAARLIASSGDQAPRPEQLASIAERIKPIGTVVTDPAALVKTSAPAVARAPMTGEQVNAKLCAGCHGAGVLGAPKIGDKAAWAARLSAAGGLDALVSHAIRGKNAMPPKGGDPSLSDDEVRAAVEFMLKQSGV
ncbi:Cytochrome c5 [Fontimonas thermophila]|uniref:Cytochrome c5 n=1 Tax=Fontimonas thermophila TaxID=1076937 RepID=A0A1I2JZT8_9GAMM|nr:c-type cytochrome [Fontimonas thermophila]SFF58256.1 Cytochrome c5 [Fontimonas thermophila]